MIGEFIEDLFHTDHRVWRTIRLMLTRPGLLTAEYLRGRRVTYTPPFRLYIVLSLIYFFTASLSHTDVNVVVAQPGHGEHAQSGQLDPDAKEQLDELLERVDKGDREEIRQRMEAALKNLPPQDQRTAVTNMFNPCSPTALGKALPETFENRDKLLDVCRKATKNQGKDFMEALKEHVPQMMFFFLPLIALFGKTLYIGSRRYYAEHLLFFVHFHAFFFLIMAVNNVLGWMLGWFTGGWAATAASLLTTGVVFYAPTYLFLAMRRVYGQSRLVTSLKFTLLLGGYIANMFIAFAIVASYTMMMLK
jgi:hypothetical protein